MRAFLTRIPILTALVAQVVATLVATAVAGAELDAVVAGLARMPGIEHATWSVQTAD